MLKCHCILSSLYLVNIIYGVTMHDKFSINIHASETLQVYNFNLNKVVFTKELVEILVISGILINLRPREWPQFFSLDVPYDPIIA